MMNNHSILAAIHHEKTQLLQYEGAVWDKLDNSNMLTSTDVQKSMEAIFSRLIMFNTTVEELLHRYFRGNNRETVAGRNAYGVKHAKYRCHKVINSFRNTNTKYLREKFLKLCKRLVPSNVAIETVKEIVSESFTLKNVENSLYFLNSFANAV